MRDHPLSGSRRPQVRRAWLAALMTAALTAVLVPVTASPAAAAPAPLVTEDGIGVRLDETALTGPALAEIETALQPFVDQMIYDGATDDDAPFQSNLWVEATSDLNLSLDFLPPDGSRPNGGLAVHADITNIEIEWRMNGFWGSGQCSIWARPDVGTVDITAAVDKDRLPLTPIALDGISATWDDDPTIDYDWNCAGHVDVVLRERNDAQAPRCGGRRDARRDFR